MKRRGARALKKRYGRSSSGFRWSSPAGGVQRLLSVAPSKGEVIVTAFPHFADVVVVPAKGQMSVEMSFPSASAARLWGEHQAKRFGFLEAR